MRILLLAPHPFFKNRGTPIAVRFLLAALSEQGHEVDVLTFPEGEDVKIPNVRISRIRRLPMLEDIPIGFSWKKVAYDIGLFFSMLGRLRNGRYDLVHAVEESAFLALIGKVLFKIPYVYDMDSSIPAQLREKYPSIRLTHTFVSRCEAAMIRNSAFVIAVCESLRRIALSHKEADRVSVLEDIPLFLNAQTSKVLNLAERFDMRGPVVMYVGNLEPYQGIDLLLESFDIVVKENIDAHLVVVGGCESDIAFYKKMASSKAIEGKVHFLGPQPVEDLSKYLAEADILVSPRIKGENTPMKIYSYMYSGKAVVATKLLTHTQVLNATNAVLMDPVPCSFADGIISLIKDPGLRDSLGKKAMRDIEENYTFSSFKRKLSRVYGFLGNPVA